MNITNTT